MKNWYAIKNNHAGVVDISIHDEIGLWGITAKEFIANLSEHKSATAINLSIHSPGGSVLDGLAIYNTLKSHPAKVHGRVEGLAGSAASFILMASDTITMPDDSFIMIHNAHGGAIGDAEDLRSVADVMEKLQDSIVNIYVKRTGQDEQVIRDMMADETWMNASDAVENGFADTISEPLGIAAKAASFGKYFRSMPVDVDSSIDGIETITDFERYLREAHNVSRGLATKLASRAKVIFQSDSEPVADPSGEILARLQRLKLPE